MSGGTACFCKHDEQKARYFLISERMIMFMEKKPVNDIKIGVIGGDLRQLVAAKELAE